MMAVMPAVASAQDVYLHSYNLLVGLAAKDSPPFAVYFALNMMLTSRDGSAHAKTEMARWMAWRIHQVA
mgnify:CR=1 FL=1